MDSTASLIAEMLASPLIDAVADVRSTCTDSMPCTPAMAFSTLARQWLQLIPLMCKVKDV